MKITGMWPDLKTYTATCCKSWQKYKRGLKKKLNVLICFELVCLAWFITSSEKKTTQNIRAALPSTPEYNCGPRDAAAAPVSSSKGKTSSVSGVNGYPAHRLFFFSFLFFLMDLHRHALPSENHIPDCQRAHGGKLPSGQSSASDSRWLFRESRPSEGFTSFTLSGVSDVFWFYSEYSQLRLPSHNNTSTGTFSEVNKYTKSIYSCSDTSLVSQRGSDWELRDWGSCWNIARLIPWKQPRPPQRFFLFASQPLLFPPRSHFSLPSRLRV